MGSRGIFEWSEDRNLGQIVLLREIPECCVEGYKVLSLDDVKVCGIRDGIIEIVQLFVVGHGVCGEGVVPRRIGLDQALKYIVHLLLRENWVEPDVWVDHSPSAWNSGGTLIVVI